jgi:hypothetical protein
MNSGKIAGMRPYDGSRLIMTFHLSTTFCRFLECGGKTPLFKARRVALSQSADISAQSK